MPALGPEGSARQVCLVQRNTPGIARDFIHHQGSAAVRTLGLDTGPGSKHEAFIDGAFHTHTPRSYYLIRAPKLLPLSCHSLGDLHVTR